MPPASHPASPSGTLPGTQSAATAPRARSEGGELVALMSARVRDARLRTPVYVDGSDDLVSVCRQLAEHATSEALVRDDGRIGIFTTTDLRDALLRSEPAAALAVREVAHFEPLSVQASDGLFDALLLMLGHRVHRVVVYRDGEVVGLLRQLDLMAFVAGHSQLIALQATRAGSVAELEVAARSIDELIRSLHEDGVRVDGIAEIVNGLNRQLFRRLWELLAPDELRRNSCLLVMGSEGRGEQIVKTDQDNGLLLRDGFEWPELPQITQRFTDALIGFGYPPCPGGIMLSRAAWCQPLASFRESLRDWIVGSDPEGPMKLAIFLDAQAVAGDAALLASARDHVDRLLSGSDAFNARFAAAIGQFREEGNWWSRLPGMRGREAAEIDLKKLGIFPLVHGVRALALQYRVRETPTVTRLERLRGMQRMDEALARDLRDALAFLMGLKLSNNLRQIQEGRAPDNRVRLADLGTLERQSLKDSLSIVRRFREWLARHYRLDAL